MGRLSNWLSGTVDTAAPAADAVSAAAGRVVLTPTRHRPLGWGSSRGLLNPFDIPAVPLWDRDAAMSIPTISRARDLICSAVGALPFTSWSINFSQVPPVEEQIPPAPWMARPDRNHTRQWILAWTTDDLFFYGAAHWLITDRAAEPMDYPVAFERIEPGELHISDDGRTTRNGHDVNPRDVVEFLSPIEGLLSNGYRAISIALQLDDAADRFAATELPTGILEEQEGGEDLSADELRALAADFAEARRANTTAAVNKYMRYREINVDASAMQLVEARTYQALELTRLGNVPPYLAGAPAGTGMTYLNGQQARQDLIDFGALPYIGCLEQTLGGPNVVPRGHAVRLELEAWLRNPFTTDATAAPSPNDLEQAYDPAATAPVAEAPA